MSTRHRLLVVLCTALALSACGKEDSDDAERPVARVATVEPVGDSSQRMITLTQQAADRIDVRLARVTSSVPPRPSVGTASSTATPTASPTARPTASSTPGPTASASPSTTDTPSPSPTTEPDTDTNSGGAPQIPRATSLVAVPFAALLYDSDGTPYVYVSPKPLTYIHDAVTVAYIVGDVAVLSAGPAAGLDVVEVGAPELSGVEYGVTENEGS